jgi:hypothetical protein
MPSMSITIERTPMTFTIHGKTFHVEKLGIRLPFARKPVALQDISGGGDDEIYVIESIAMTPEEYDEFASNFLLPREWLAGKGSYAGQGRFCVEVHAPGRPYLYVDPSGSNYGRYVARLG